MAEGGEGTSFENPAFDPDPCKDDDYGDEKTPFIQNGEGEDKTSKNPAFKPEDWDETNSFIANGASTPAPGEEIEMQTMPHEKEGLPETSYVETGFGAQTSSERAWIAAKELFPNMSSSELEVLYNTKGRLQVKMFGAGKKSYNLMTTEKGTGREQINKGLPKEIKNALGESKYEQKAAREKYKKKQMDEEREKIKKEQQNLGSLENEDTSQRDIDRVKAKINSLENQHFIARTKYEKTFPADDDDEERIERNTSVMEKIKPMDKQNTALNIHIFLDIGLSENVKTHERQKEAKERLERNKTTFEKK